MGSQCEDAAGRTPLSLRTRWGEKGGIGITEVDVGRDHV